MYLLILPKDELDGHNLDPKAGVYESKEYGFFVVIKKKHGHIAIRARNGKYYPDELHLLVFVDAQLNVYPSGDWRVGEVLQFKKAEHVWPEKFECRQLH